MGRQETYITSNVNAECAMRWVPVAIAAGRGGVEIERVCGVGMAEGISACI